MDAEKFFVEKAGLSALTTILGDELKKLDNLDKFNETATSIFISLGIFHKKDVENFQKIKLQRPNWNKSEIFLDLLLTDWVKENKGKVDLMQLIETLRSHHLPDLASKLQMGLINYALPIKHDSICAEDEIYIVFEKEKNHPLETFEKVLTNPVILTEIFKNASSTGLRSYRRVNKVWYTETLPFWRKTVPITIYVHEEVQRRLVGRGARKVLPGPSVNPRPTNHLTMDTYEGLLWTEKGKKETKWQEFLTKPYQNFIISYGVPARWGEDGCESPTTDQYPFWEKTGPNMKSLTLKNGKFTPVEEEYMPEYFFRRLLLEVCPVLEELNISKMFFSRITDGYYGEVEESTEDERVAENLKSLILGQHSEHFKSVFKLCPNLKHLTLESEELLKELLQPTANHEFISLESISFKNETNCAFANLQKYTEHFSDSILHLQFKKVFLYKARQPPFHLYTALGECKNLKSLKLTIASYGSDIDNIWFMDLSPFFFKNLTQLKLVLESFPSFTGEEKSLKFDFNSLRGMSQLEELVVVCLQNKFKATFLSSGTRDWLYEGPRDLYLPQNIQSYSEDKPILCKKLKKFTFYGWDLTNDDVQFLSGCFPNLSSLETNLSLEAVPCILNYWKHLDRLHIRTEKVIPLHLLCHLKQERNHLKITQLVTNGENVRNYQFVEVKQQRELFYFESADIKDEKDVFKVLTEHNLFSTIYKV